MKYTTRHGEFETEKVVECFEGDFLPIVWLRENAIAEDGREGFYDHGNKTLYLFKKGDQE